MAKLVLGTNKNATLAGVYKIVEETYPLFTRVKDDFNNEIGTIFNYRYDSRGKRTHICVVADGHLRAKNMEYMDTTVQIPTILSSNNWVELTTFNEMATSNTQKTLDYCNQNSYHCPPADHCRSYSFIFHNNIYFWQIPLIKDILQLKMFLNIINDLDGHPRSGLQIYNSIPYFTSDQNGSYVWLWPANSTLSPMYRDFAHNSGIINHVLVPIAELPIN